MHFSTHKNYTQRAKLPAKFAVFTFLQQQIKIANFHYTWAQREISSNHPSNYDKTVNLLNIPMKLYTYFTNVFWQFIAIGRHAVCSFGCRHPFLPLKLFMYYLYEHTSASYTFNFRLNNRYDSMLVYFFLIPSSNYTSLVHRVQ